VHFYIIFIKELDHWTSKEIGNLFNTINKKIGRYLVQNEIDGSNFRKLSKKKFLTITKLDITDHYTAGSELKAKCLWKKLSCKPNKK
jgi:hypothetical protein